MSEIGMMGFLSGARVAEVTADERARVTLTKAGVHASERFIVSALDSGEIVLTPVASVPKRELIVWEDEQVRQSLQRGIADAEAGRVRRLPELLDDLDQS